LTRTRRSASGLMVVFRCREQNNQMNACLGQYTNDEAVETYKLKRERELAAAARASEQVG